MFSFVVNDCFTVNFNKYDILFYLVIYSDFLFYLILPG